MAPVWTLEKQFTNVLALFANLLQTIFALFTQANLH